MLKHVKSLARSVRKNWPDIEAYISGRMPSFVYGSSSIAGIPVFCFHDADAQLLRSQLEFLRRNRFRFLAGDEFQERILDPHYRNTDREILLTFDDGLASVWEHGFPLLQEFEAKMVLFVVAELVPQSDDPAPLATSDATDHNARTSRVLDLCTWPQLLHMEQSGLVDVQSHSCLHARISTGPKVIDFVRPGFPLGAFGTAQANQNTRVPLYRDALGRLTRRAVLGHPIYENSSLFATDAHFPDDSSVRETCADFVRRNGGEQFFSRPGWEDELQSIVSAANRNKPDNLTLSSAEPLMRRELSESKRLIEERLGKQVRHFCFPWYQFNDMSLQIAQECGYETAHVGPVSSQPKRHASGILVVPRLQHEYLFRLPGDGRKGLAHLIQLKKVLAAKRAYGN